MTRSRTAPGHTARSPTSTMLNPAHLPDQPVEPGPLEQALHLTPRRRRPGESDQQGERSSVSCPANGSRSSGSMGRRRTTPSREAVSRQRCEGRRHRAGRDPRRCGRTGPGRAVRPATPPSRVAADALEPEPGPQRGARRGQVGTSSRSSTRYTALLVRPGGERPRGLGGEPASLRLGSDPVADVGGAHADRQAQRRRSDQPAGRAIDHGAVQPGSGRPFLAADVGHEARSRPRGCTGRAGPGTACRAPLLMIDVTESTSSTRHGRSSSRSLRSSSSARSTPRKRPTGTSVPASRAGALACTAAARTMAAVVLAKLLRAGEGKMVRRLSTIADHIETLEDDYVDLTDAELRAHTDTFKERLRRRRDARRPPARGVRRRARGRTPHAGPVPLQGAAHGRRRPAPRATSPR